MNAKFLTAAILFGSLCANAQVPSDGPPIAWQTVDWAPTEFDGTTPQSQKNSGEEWWFDFKPVYDSNGDQYGYLATGFASWKNLNDVYPEGSCILDGEPTFNDCEGAFRTDDWYAGPTNVQTMGLYNLNGKMIWCKSYNPGEFYHSVQAPDKSGFVVVGHLRDTYDRTQLLYDWEGTSDGFIRYNPAINESEFTLNGEETSEPCDMFGVGEKPAKFFSVTKVDNDGEVVWSYAYGAKDPSFGQDINRYASFGYDLVAYESSSEIHYRCVGSAVSDLAQLERYFVFDLDEDGMLNWKYQPTSTEQSIAFAISHYNDGSSDRFFVGGTIEDGSGFDGLVTCHTGVTSNTLEWTHEIDETWDNELSSTLKNEVWAVDFDHEDNLLLATITDMTSSTITDGNREAEGEGVVYTITNTTVGATVQDERDKVEIGTVKAYDLKIDVEPTSDNGIAIVSTKNDNVWSENSFQAYVINPYAMTPPDYAAACSTSLLSWHYWNYNSDAYIRKCTLDNGEWELYWEKTFDSPGERGGFPGDVKKQECVYSIHEADDGGLVICGNTSHNFDDYYLVKIEGDCELTNSDLMTPEEISASDWDEYATNKFRLEASSSPYTISNNGDYDYVKGLIVVPKNTKLIIDGATIEFGDGSKLGYPTGILVERGGELEIKNGAVLQASTSCETEGVYTMWDGIKVQGTPTVGNISSAQGSVEILANCTIRDARIGILAGDEYSFKYKWSGGGVVMATQATFLNNRRDVVLYPYERSRTAPWFEESYLWHSTFINTEQLRDKHSSWEVINCVDYPVGASHHVTLWDVHGVEIVGCDFQGSTNIDSKVWATGISSFNATYEVDCATENASGCVSAANDFDKLRIGIDAGASMPLVAPHINGNSFTDISETGIYMKGVTYADIINNEFTQQFGQSSYYSGENLTENDCDKCKLDARAIYLYNCNRYLVEGNEIEGQSSGYVGFMGTGIEIFNTSPTQTDAVHNEIYRNSFTDLSYASFGNGENTGGNAANNTSGNYGLDMLCGEYLGNLFDILSIEITEDDVPENERAEFESLETYGISKYQGFYGGNSSPAGNRFDDCTEAEAEIFIDDDVEHLNYIYHGINGTSDIIMPDPYCHENGSLDGQSSLDDDDESTFSLLGSCPSEYEHASRKAYASDAVSDAETEYLAFVTTVDNTIDNGDTQNLLDMITNDDADASLESVFSSVSPYLSDEVLIAAIEDKPTPMNSAILTDILIDNSPISYAVQTSVDNRSPAIATIDLDRLDGYQDGSISARSILEGQLSHKKAAIRFAKNEQIRAHIFDFDGTKRLDTIIIILDDEGDSLSIAELSTAYLLDGQSTKAQTESDKLDGSEKWGDYSALLSDLISWSIDSINVDTILRDTGLFGQLEMQASNTSDIASMPSQVILEFLNESWDQAEPRGNYIIHPISAYPDITILSPKRNSDPEKDDELLKLEFTAYPNPFSDIITFDIGESLSDEIIVTDLRGAILTRLTIGDEQRLVEWNSSQLPAGIYIALLSSKGVAQSLKVIKY